MASMQLPGARIHYEVAGSGGQTYVLVHGGCCTHRDWDAQVGALSRDATVIAPDLRCHGLSSGTPADCTIERWAADVNALVEASGVGPVTLVGHSLGARVVAEAASQRPDLADALVLLDGSRSIGGFAATAPTGEPAPTVAAGVSLEAILDVTIGPYADARTRARVRDAMKAAPEPVMHQTVAAYTAWDSDRADTVYAELPASVPVLAIQSTYHDRFTARRSLARGETTPYLNFLKRAVPRIEIAVLPETGHFSMMERSAAVTGLIREFATRARRRMPDAPTSTRKENIT